MSYRTKFGFFCSALLSIAGAVALYLNFNVTGLTFITFSLIFALLAISDNPMLELFLRLWGGLGRFLGRLSNPIILAVIYFGLFTPVAITMRIIGRDELSLRKKNSCSFWKNRDDVPTQEEGFKNQF